MPDERHRAPQATSPAVRAVMRANRGRDTQPEMAIRRALHAMGYRFRIDHRPLGDARTRADIVFTRKRVAIYVDGCFWHGCSEHYRAAQRNAGFWRAKVDATRRRDVTTTETLQKAGWRVIRVWEHESVEGAIARIESVLRGANEPTDPES